MYKDKDAVFSGPRNLARLNEFLEKMIADWGIS
jgi:hypothetical protein